jgi:PAS domain S-box-containing protein
VENATDYAILILDTQGRVVNWSAGAQQVLGWREEEVAGRHVSFLSIRQDRAAGVAEREMETAEAEGRAASGRWHLRRDGSRIFADGVMTSLRDEAGRLRGFGLVLRDVTERKSAQDALRAAFHRERKITEALQRPLTLEVAEDAFPDLLVATLYEPALSEAEVGGDFFDAFTLPREGVALAVADASGKGLPAAARTMQVREVLRAFARESPRSPDRVASRLNEFVCDTKEYDDYPEEAFVTVALMTLDPRTGVGAVVTAGSEPLLVLRADGGEAEVVGSPGGLPLGVLRGEAFAATPVHLGVGDTLLIFTDGLTEARRGGDFLGYEGVVELARRSLADAASLRAAGKAILNGARVFAGGALHDDACLLLARRPPPESNA